MEKKIEYVQFENTHWWFVARRQILDKLISFFVKKDSPFNSLEIGAATGGNLMMLSKYGHLHAIEYDNDSCEQANKRNICKVIQHELPNKLPFSQKFHAMFMFDVLEHIEEDVQTLKCLKDHLAADGTLFISVPAYQWLWSDHDEISEHKRRYTLSNLKQKCSESGYTIEYASYFNTFLFPLIAITRFLNNLTGKKGSDISIPSPSVNKCLTYIFAFERYFLPSLRFLFGVSIFIVLRNRDKL